jgi:hypothetical protein
MNGASHLRRARQRCGAGEPGIKDRDGDSVIGLDLIVVIGEHQRRAGLERARHLAIHRRESFSELDQPARLGRVASELVRRARRSAIEPLGSASNQPAQPSIAEIHQLAVLHIPKIWRIGKYLIEALSV